jgi:hypothetical protein
MMKIENDCIFVAEEVIGRDLFVVNKVTTKNKTLSKTEELRIIFLIVYNVIELFICFVSAFSKCKQLVVIIVGVNDLLHE